MKATIIESRKSKKIKWSTWVNIFNNVESAVKKLKRRNNWMNTSRKEISQEKLTL